jgi:lysophospholipase L1-like esterase
MPDVPFLLVTIPTSEMHASGLRPAYAERFDELCKELPDILHVDVWDPLLDSSVKKLVYLPYDGHLTPTGHRVVGEAIVSAIRKWTQ